MRRLLPALLALVTAVALAAPAQAAAGGRAAHHGRAGWTTSRSGATAAGHSARPTWLTGAAARTAMATAGAAGTGALPARRLPGAHSVGGAADVTLAARPATAAAPQIVSSAPAGAEQVLTTVGAFAGSGNGLAPPDDAVASSGTQVIHVTNLGLLATDVEGHVLGFAPLASFFVADAGYNVSDPQVVFDKATGRWFLSVVEYNATTIFDSKILLEVSTGADLFTASFTRFAALESPGTLLDQPRLGITSDKLLFSVEDFDSGGFLGPDAIVLNKAEALGGPGSTISWAAVFDYPQDFGLAPSVNSASGTTGWFVTAGTAPSNVLRVVGVTGVPDTTTPVTYHPVDLSIGLATAAPPVGHAPGAVTVDAGDERIQSVSWAGSNLLVVAGQSCVPFGDANTRPCLRFWRVSTATTTLLEDQVIGVPNIDLADAAGVQDGVGGVHFAGTAMSPTVEPSLVAFGRPAGGPWPSALTYLVAPGSPDYAGGGSNPQRWGDYTGLALDPLRPADVWIAGEHVDPSSTGVPNWMTSVARVSLAADVVTTTRSVASLTTGGAVTITGKLTRPGGAAVVSARLDLWKKPHTSAVWSLASAGTTSTAGTRAVVDHPTVNEDYQWRYPGSALVDGIATLLSYTTPVTGVATLVLVAPKVSIVSNKTSMVHGSTVTFSGAVSPNHSGKRVYLQRYLGAGRWGNVTYKALSTSSTYAFALKISSIGTFTYRVWFVADTDHTTAYSAGKAIKVT